MNSAAKLRLFPLYLIIYITDGFIHITLFLTNNQAKYTLFLTKGKEMLLYKVIGWLFLCYNVIAADKK